MQQPTATTPAGRIAFFRPGRHTSVDGREIEFTPAQLADAVASYSAEAHEAPLVVGHPQLNTPAYGWAAKLHVRDDGTLVADTKQVDPGFAELVNAGRFKKVSASWYLPDSPGNPKPGHLYLRHIGFLGAAPPALKGLPDASFGENDGAVTVEFAESATPIADLFRKLRQHLFGGKNAQAEAVLPDAAIAAIASDESEDAAEETVGAPSVHAETGAITETHMTDQNLQAAEFAEREAALKTQSDAIAAREQAIKDREAAIATAEAAAHKRTVAEFVEGLAKKGQLLPRHKAPMIEVLCAFEPSATVSFAEGDRTVSKNPAELLREFLGSLPPQIDFSEKSSDTGQGNGAASFAAPDNAAIDTGRLEIHSKAIAYQNANKGVSYLDAVRAVGG